MTTYDLRYRFSASGQGDVVKAYQSIGSAAARAATAEARGAARGEAAAEKAAAAKAAAATKAGRAQEREADKAARAAEKAAKGEERAARLAADAKIREGKRADRELDRLSKRMQREQMAEIRQAERMRERAAQKRSRSLGRFGDSVGSFAMNAAMGLGAGATAVVGLAARKEFALRDKTLAISRDTREAGKEAVNPETLAREFQATALASPGQTAEGIADAIKAFTTKTGNLDMARKLQGTFATTANATGANISDISGAAADIMQKFDISSLDEMREAMAKLTFQGKKGAFELKDAAAEFPAIASAAQRFGLDKGVKGVQTLGGLMQIAREATPSGAEASTAVEQMFTQLVAKSSKLKNGEFGGAKVNVFDKNGQARDIKDVLVDTIAGVGGNDMEKKKQGLQQVFDVRGIRAVTPLIDAYAQAVKNGTDPIKAMRDKMRDAIDVTASWKDIQQDASMTQQTASAQLAAAWESLSAKVGDQVVPELAKLVSSVANTPGLFDALAGTAGVLASAFVGVIDVLKMIPGVGDLFKEKPKTIEEQIAAKKEELAKFDNETNARMAKDPNSAGLTDQEAAKEAKLTKELAALEMTRSLASDAGGTIGEDDFKARFSEVNSLPGQHDNAMKALEAYNNGRPEAQKIEFDEASQQLINAAEKLSAASEKIGSRDGWAGAKGDPLGGVGGKL